MSTSDSERRGRPRLEIIAAQSVAQGAAALILQLVDGQTVSGAPGGVDGDEVVLRQFGGSSRYSSADIVAYQALNPV